jgi:hypothetical protein
MFDLPYWLRGLALIPLRLAPTAAASLHQSSEDEIADDEIFELGDVVLQPAATFRLGAGAAGQERRPPPRDVIGSAPGNGPGFAVTKLNPPFSPCLPCKKIKVNVGRHEPGSDPSEAAIPVEWRKACDKIGFSAELPGLTLTAPFNSIGARLQ